MSPPIFATYAPQLWKLGLSAIPIAVGTKQPPIKKWSGYCDNIPKAETQREWLTQYAQCGFGVCLGRESRPGLRLAAIDVDRESLRRPVRGLLGNPACAKRGKKGETFFVLAEKALKSTSLRDANDRPAIDILIGGRQTVLPPTVHPETDKPYEWLGRPLTECSLDDLPIFDQRKFEILKVIVASEHAAALINGGNDDDA